MSNKEISESGGEWTRVRGSGSARYGSPLPMYDGMTDPQDHVTTFKTQMLKRVLDDALQCKLFSWTLTGAVMIWFSNLPPLSIVITQDFIKKFLIQFSTRRSRMMTSGKLFNAREKIWLEDKTTRRPGKKFQISRDQDAVFRHPKINSMQDNGRIPGKESQNFLGERGSTGRPMMQGLTPLNTSRARILKEMYRLDLLKFPPLREGLKGPDAEKWCDYH
ncbi:hypothetical protein SESBI_11958 [Sesbania bispinosa]|nr:hypothetical protein SESBI_11958 [Sesbania bispinosa]